MLMTADHNSHTSHNSHATPSGSKTVRDPKLNLSYVALDQGRYSPTLEGTPQGGGISPLLLNIALQGMEAAAGVKYDPRGRAKAGCPTVITYADDFVALCHSREQAETVR